MSTPTEGMARRRSRAAVLDVLATRADAAATAALARTTDPVAQELADVLRALVAEVRRDVPPRTAWTVREAAASLGISYKRCLELIHSKRLAAIPAGQHYIVPIAALDAFLDSATPIAS